MDYQILFSPEISGESIKAWRASGKKAVGVICCHVPVEIMHALEIMPVRLRATGCTESPDGDAWMSTFSCSYARGMLQNWISGKYELDGIITSDGCMMASRCFDNAKHIDEEKQTGKLFFQFGVSRKQGALELKYLINELKDLIDVLEKLSGNKLTDEKLKASIAKYNEARALMQQIFALRKEKEPVISGTEMLCLTMKYCDLPIDEYIELLKEFLADVKNRKPITGKRARLMLIGSALDDPEYVKVIEDKGGLFVADALCYGSRCFNSLLEVDEKDVLGSVAKYYLTRIVCPRIMDNRVALQQWIADTAKEYAVDGVVYEKMQYCECWGGESMFLEPKLADEGIPMLTLEREEHMSNAGQLAIRAEAFVEMIEKEN